MVTYIDYVFVSPFLLVSAKNFVLDFFLNVQVVRTDDLHLLQFFTKPALKLHIDIYLLIVYFGEKVQLFGRVSPEDKRNSSRIERAATHINTGD